MTQASRQQNLIALFEQTRLAVCDLAASTPESARDSVSGSEAWSPAQLVSAITFWIDYTRDRVGYFDRGEMPPREVDFEGVQNEALAASTEMTWQERLQAFERAVDELVAWMEACSDARLEQENSYGDGPGDALWGEIQANGFIWPLQELEKHYQRQGEMGRARQMRRLLVPVVGEEERIVCDLITPEALARLKRDGRVLVVDVRDRGEYARGHVAGARSLPLSDLPSALDTLPTDRAIVTYCTMHHPGQSRGERAAAILAANGYTASAIAGGFPAYEASGLPVEIE